MKLIDFLELDASIKIECKSGILLQNQKNPMVQNNSTNNHSKCRKYFKLKNALVDHQCRTRKKVGKNNPSHTLNIYWYNGWSWSDQHVGNGEWEFLWRNCALYQNTKRSRFLFSSSPMRNGLRSPFVVWGGRVDGSWDWKGGKGGQKVNIDLRQQKKKNFICFGSLFSTDSRGKGIYVFLRIKLKPHRRESHPGANSNSSQVAVQRDNVSPTKGWTMQISRSEKEPSRAYQRNLHHLAMGRHWNVSSVTSKASKTSTSAWAKSRASGL